MKRIACAVVLVLFNQAAFPQATGISCPEVATFTSVIAVLRNAGYPLERARYQIDRDPNFSATEKHVLKEMANLVYAKPRLTPADHALLSTIACHTPQPAASQHPVLGRLFFTPEQRAALDARRKARVPDMPTVAPASPVMRLDGYVKRAGGRSTVWVNGESLREGGPEIPHIDPDRDGRISVRRGDSARAAMKPGEVFSSDSGEVRDVVGTNAIRVHRMPRESTISRDGHYSGPTSSGTGEPAR